MGEKRVFTDCREMPSENNCSLRIAGRESEVLDAAVDHAVKAHRHERTPQLREDIRSSLKEERE